MISGCKCRSAKQGELHPPLHAYSTLISHSFWFQSGDVYTHNDTSFYKLSYTWGLVGKPSTTCSLAATCQAVENVHEFMEGSIESESRKFSAIQHRRIES